MEAAPASEVTAVARGGPMDGAILGAADAESYEVGMSDGTRWTYTVTGERERLADSTLAVVFVCSGRA